MFNHTPLPRFIGRGKSPLMGNAKCGECKKYFKFPVAYYWKDQFCTCTYCNNVNDNSLIALDLNGSNFTDKQLDAIERSNELIKEYASKHKYRSIHPEFPYIIVDKSKEA